MKRMMLFALCSLLAGATVAQAATTPLVELLFNDAPSLTTANLGSLGGTQNLPSASGYKDANVPVPPAVSFNSGTSWLQAGWVLPSYGTYNLPALSSYTVAFWLDNAIQDGGFRNVFASNLATGGQEFGAYYTGSTGALHLLGPGGTRFIDVPGVVPYASWTHVAYTYDSTSATATVYINGQSVSFDGSWSGTIAASNTGISIADASGSSNLYGLVDNLFIYDSVLSQAQIQSLKTTNELPIPEPATLGLLALGLFGLVSRRART